MKFPLPDRRPLTPPDDEPEFECPACGDCHLSEQFLVHRCCPSCEWEIPASWGRERDYEDDD